MAIEERPKCLGKHWSENSRDCRGGLNPAYTDRITGSHIQPACVYYDVCKTQTLISKAQAASATPAPAPPAQSYYVPLDKLRGTPAPQQQSQQQTPAQAAPSLPTHIPQQALALRPEHIANMMNWLSQYGQPQQQQQNPQNPQAPYVPQAPPMFASPTVGQIEGMDFRVSPMLAVPEPEDGGSYITRFLVEGGRAGMKGLFDQWGNFLNKNPLLSKKKG